VHEWQVYGEYLEDTSIEILSHVLFLLCILAQIRPCPRTS
jgi:hypothetical protein